MALSRIGLGVRFAELIEKVAKGASSSRALVLIDGYDNPVIDYLDVLDLAEKTERYSRSFTVALLAYLASTRYGSSPTSITLRTSLGTPYFAVF